jgi:hypothetical protein
LHFSGNKRSSCIFCKIIFESTTHHFFTKFWLLMRDSEPPGREREFSCIAISHGSWIRRN